MADKYLSIITNFGCHYSCPECVVRNNNLKMTPTGSIPLVMNYGAPFIMIALIATGYLYPAVAIRYGSGLIIRSGGHTFSILAESLAVRLNCIPVIMMLSMIPTSCFSHLKGLIESFIICIIWTNWTRFIVLAVKLFV